MVYVRLQVRLSGQTAGLAAGQTAGQVAGLAAGQAAGLAAGLAAGQVVGLAAGHTARQVAGQAAGQIADQTASQAAGQTVGEAAGQVSGQVAGLDLLLVPLYCTMYCKRRVVCLVYTKEVQYREYIITTGKYKRLSPLYQVRVHVGVRLTVSLLSVDGDRIADRNLLKHEAYSTRETVPTDGGFCTVTPLLYNCGSRVLEVTLHNTQLVVYTARGRRPTQRH